MLNYVLVVLALIVAVIIHELGHAYTMRKYGVRIERFGIGLPIIPVSFDLNIKNLPTVSLYPIFLGAFVQPVDEHAIERLPHSQRMHIFAEGVFWNLMTLVVALAGFALLLIATNPSQLWEQWWRIPEIVGGVAIFLGRKWIAALVPILGTALLAFIVYSMFFVESTTSTGSENTSGVIGPIGIVDAFGSSGEPFLIVLLALSVGIGLANMLPIPPLDGGRVLLTLLEFFNVSKRVIKTLLFVGTGLLLLFIAFIMFQDISNLLS